MLNSRYVIVSFLHVFFFYCTVYLISHEIFIPSPVLSSSQYPCAAGRFGGVECWRSDPGESERKWHSHQIYWVAPEATAKKTQAWQCTTYNVSIIPLSLDHRREFHTQVLFIHWLSIFIIWFHFCSGAAFLGSTVGLANKFAMCTDASGAVNQVISGYAYTCKWTLCLQNSDGNLVCDIEKDAVWCFVTQDHSSNPLGLAATIAHELGHNMGMSHDAQGCTCGPSNCIMTDVVK